MPFVKENENYESIPHCKYGANAKSMFDYCNPYNINFVVII